MFFLLLVIICVDQKLQTIYAALKPFLENPKADQIKLSQICNFLTTYRVLLANDLYL